MKKLLFILVSFPLLTFSQVTPAGNFLTSQGIEFYPYTPARPWLKPGAVTTDHGRIGFYEFRPPGYNTDSSGCYPLIIFLHGVGERGNGTSELSMVLNSSFSQLIANGASMNFAFHGKKNGFIVLLPQMSKDYINWQNFYTDAMIGYAKQHLKVDTNRIFLCGWSLGGGGAWKYVTTSLDNASRIAGIVVTGPAPDYEDLSYIAKAHVAVWAHHAQDDASVALHLTTDAVRKVNSYIPAIPARGTYYRSGGHPLIAKVPFDTLNTYLYPNIYQWMMGTSRKNSLATNQPPVPVSGNDTAIIAPSRLLLDGSASYDPQDVIIRYRWRMIAGPVSAHLLIEHPDSPVASVSGLELGSYTFRLTVADEFGFTRSDDVHVQVSLPPGGKNASPYVNAGCDTATTEDHFSAKGYCKDLDGKVERYSWRQISGPVPIYIAQHETYAILQHMTEEGTYGIELTAYDNHLPAGVGKDTVLIKKIASVSAPVLYRFVKQRIYPDETAINRNIMLFMCLCFLITPLYLMQIQWQKTVWFSRFFPFRCNDTLA